MLVQKGDILVRDQVPYQVVCADEELFIIGPMTVSEDDKDIHVITSYTDLEAYTNDASINSLEELNFIKTN